MTLIVMRVNINMALIRQCSYWCSQFPDDVILIIFKPNFMDSLILLATQYCGNFRLWMKQSDIDLPEFEEL